MSRTAGEHTTQRIYKFCFPKYRTAMDANDMRVVMTKRDDADIEVSSYMHRISMRATNTRNHVAGSNPNRIRMMGPKARAVRALFLISVT
jgi:hypothetical protein